MKPVYIFDIDGTLASCGDRVKYIVPPDRDIFEGCKINWEPDWDSFYAECDKDKPIEDVCRLCRELHVDVLYVTGRPERCRAQTSKWLHDNDLPDGGLFMREDNDHRQDWMFKQDVYNTYIKGRYEILGVFEDRTQCVQMWRRNGLTCFQVANGDY